MNANSKECEQYSTCMSDGTTGLKCTCDTGYYDNNFSATGGLCVQGLFSLNSNINKTYICLVMKKIELENIFFVENYIYMEM